MAKITEIYGNIFESTCQAIVNSVNCVGIMGKGVALEYKYRFPDMFQEYVNICNKEMLKPGLLQLYTKSTPWVLNFPTKIYWKNPSKLEYVEKGLIKFRDTYVEKGITSIAFPELGTHSGGLRWEDIQKLMYLYLKPLKNIDVDIYHYDPKAKDSMFDNLYQQIHLFDIDQYIDYIDLGKSQAKLLMETIKNGNIHTMIELQNIKGFGDKSIELLYSFIIKNKSITTVRKQQLDLF